MSRLISESEFHDWFARFDAQQTEIAAVASKIRAYHAAQDVNDRMGALGKLEKAVKRLRTAFEPANATDPSPAEPELSKLEADLKVEEKKVLKEFKASLKKAEEERKAQHVADVESRLAGNRFNVKSNLAWYKETLPGFEAALDDLKSGDQWMDSGAGLALAMQDYAAKGKATMVAVAYKKPAEGDEKVTTADVSQLQKFETENVGRFSYLSGKYFGDFSASELAGSGNGYRLITDLNGVLTYTRDLSSDLEKFLNMLTFSPPGKLIAIISASINHDGSGSTFTKWLTKNGGVEVRKTGISTWVLTRTTKEEIKLPPLTVESYENVKNSTPARQYEWK